MNGDDYKKVKKRIMFELDLLGISYIDCSKLENSDNDSLLLKNPMEDFGDESIFIDFTEDEYQRSLDIYKCQ